MNAVINIASGRHILIYVKLLLFAFLDMGRGGVHGYIATVWCCICICILCTLYWKSTIVCTLILR